MIITYYVRRCTVETTAIGFRRANCGHLFIESGATLQSPLCTDSQWMVPGTDGG